MPVLRNEELEAAIVRDPDDLTSYAVYGDWLSEKGDPRGELIATQIAADTTNDPEMRRAALRVFAKHRDYLLGDLGKMIGATAFEWRAGFIRRATITPDQLLVEDGARVTASLADVVGALLANSSARFLLELEVLTTSTSWSRTTDVQSSVIHRLAARRPRVLRRLRLGTRIGRIDEANAALAGLQQLELEGEYSLGKLDLPELRTVMLSPMPLRRRDGHQLVEAQWPKLRTLHIQFNDYPDHVSREITSLVGRTDMPELAHLALIKFRAANEVIAALAGSPMLPRLETIDLSYGSVSDAGLRPILRDADRFRHLARLDVSNTRVSRATFERLVRVVPNAVGNYLSR